MRLNAEGQHTGHLHDMQHPNCFATYIAYSLASLSCCHSALQVFTIQPHNLQQCWPLHANIPLQKRRQSHVCALLG